MKDNIEKMAEEYTSDLVTQSGNDKKAIIIGRDYLHKIMADFAEFHHREKMKDVIDDLNEAIAQIEYLHKKFKRTGSGHAVIARLKYRISDLTKTEEG